PTGASNLRGRRFGRCPLNSHDRRTSVSVRHPPTTLNRSSRRRYGAPFPTTECRKGRIGACDLGHTLWKVQGRQAISSVHGGPPARESAIGPPRSDARDKRGSRARSAFLGNVLEHPSIGDCDRSAFDAHEAGALPLSQALVDALARRSDDVAEL